MIASNLSDCSESKHRVVGLDAEWNHVYGMRAFGSKIGNIAIVSICSPRGYCALFRMNKFGKIPSSLEVSIFFASTQYSVTPQITETIIS